MQQILEKVLKRIQPPPTEIKKFQKTTTNFLKKLNSQLKNAKAILGGSGEKDTWLSGSHDIDIFVLFNPKNYQDQDLSQILEETLKKAFPKQKIARLHGSRDYFQTQYQTYLFEIVPILKINKSNQALNITDISPLHAQWVKKSHKKIRDQIRLTKQFAKANNCYGAESYISGFSGYVLEILTIYYQSFENLITSATRWENKDLIDIEKHYKDKVEVFKQINRSKLQSPLIIVDPVDKNRNAAAALNLEKFLLFRQKAQEFTSQPDLKFFEKEKITFKTLEKQTLYNLAYLEITPLAGKEDVIGTRLLKAFQFLKKSLKDFEIQESNWNWDQKNKAIFYFILEKRHIPSFYVRSGPPLKFEEHLKEFKKKNKKHELFEEKNRIMAKIKRKHFNLQDYLKESLKHPYFKERIKSVKTLKFG